MNLSNKNCYLATNNGDGFVQKCDGHVNWEVNENNEESSNSGQNSFQINLDVLIPSLMHIKDPIAWSQISVFIPYFLPSRNHDPRVA